MSPKLFNILLILLPAVIYFGYLGPAYSGEQGLIWTPERGITGLQAENVQYKNSINQLDLIQTETEKLKKDYGAVTDEMKSKMSIMLPDTIDQIKVRNEIVTLAAKANIAVQNLKVEKNLKGGEKGFYFYTITFDVKSRYPAFKRFMEYYEKNMRFFVLESASISRQEKLEGQEVNLADDNESLNMKVTSRVYYMKQ